MRRRLTIPLLIVVAAGFVQVQPVALGQQQNAPSDRKLITKVIPVYPELAKKMAIRGTVRVQAIIAPNGAVKSTKIMGGHPVLAQAAVNAVSKWKFGAAAQESSQLIELKFDPE